jgi:hypothetical protein
MDYTIERQDSVSTVCATYQESEIIEAANLRWSAADDLPEGTEFAVFQFGGVTFKVFRAVEPVARHEERPVEGTGWYVYVGGQDAGGPFETEADALNNWRN